ncbi:hypothetical protein DMENIID0001_165820 [Sergentomyia squamirostris]
MKPGGRLVGRLENRVAEDVKRRFCYFRDSFTRILRKAVYAWHEDEAPASGVNWKHFKQMQFLTKHIHIRKIQPEKDQGEDEDEVEFLENPKEEYTLSSSDGSTSPNPVNPLEIKQEEITIKCEPPSPSSSPIPPPAKKPKRPLSELSDSDGDSSDVFDGSLEEDFTETAVDSFANLVAATIKGAHLQSQQLRELQIGVLTFIQEKLTEFSRENVKK